MKKWILMMVLGVLLAACGGAADEPQTLTVMTHDSFAVSEDVIAAFEEEHNVTVQFLMAGDTGSALNRAVLAGDTPLADVFYGVDNTFLSRALEEDIFVAYESPLLDAIPDVFELDAEHRALPVDYGEVCINYDLAYFAEHGLAAPSSLDDLLDPAYEGLLVVENPATSSPGLAFMLATVGTYGEDGFLDFWAALRDNGVHVVNDWETAYYTAFSRWGGSYPMVVSYGSSPPVEMIFAEEPMEAPITGAVTAPGTCFRQIEFVGILKGTENEALAQAWVDFMLSTPFQEDIPLQMFVFPVNENAALDPIFEEFLAVAEQPATVDPAAIAAQREAWVDAWLETVIR